jgi:hypothetical protein
MIPCGKPIPTIFNVNDKNVGDLSPIPTWTMMGKTWLV